MLENINSINCNDDDIKKLKSLTDDELTKIFNQITLEEIEELMDELNGGEKND